MIQTCFQISFASDFRYLKLNIKNALEFLQNEIPGVAEDDIFELQIIYNELLNNALIHGNKMDYTKSIEIIIEIDNSTVMSSVKDEGEGFDYASFLDSVETLNDINMYQDHGRGLQLVIGLTDLFEWNEEGNQIIFYKNLHIN